MEKNIFVKKDKQKYGPFTQKEVEMLVSEGLIEAQNTTKKPKLVAWLTIAALFAAGMFIFIFSGNENILDKNTNQNAITTILTTEQVSSLQEAQAKTAFNSADHTIYLLVSSNTRASELLLSTEWWYQDAGYDTLLLADNKKITGATDLQYFALQRPVFGWDIGNYYVVTSVTGMPVEAITFTISD